VAVPERGTTPIQTDRRRECLRGLDRSDFERAKDAIRNAAERYRVGGGFVLPAVALCVCAVG
jgi:hypothetical protein